MFCPVLKFLQTLHNEIRNFEKKIHPKSNEQSNNQMKKIVFYATLTTQNWAQYLRTCWTLQNWFWVVRCWIKCTVCWFNPKIKNQKLRGEKTEQQHKMIVRLFRVLSFGKLNTQGIGIRLVWYIVGSNGSLISICFCRTETFFTPTQVHASYTRTHVNHLIVEQRVRTKSSEEEKERKKEIVYCFFSVLVL